MKGLALILAFAAGFGLGVLVENRRLEDRCNEIVEKEFESFRRFRKDIEKSKKKKDEEGVADESEVQDRVEKEPATDDTPDEEPATDELEATSKIILKSEYGILNYDVRALEIFEEADRIWVEDVWGKEYTPSEAEDMIGVPLEDLFDDDDQTSAFVRNDRDKIYYEIVREV